ncbi:MAG: acyl-ACP--UDP-N-acetylglucosamine O-acyltransferase [Candidatus Krumholzibacteria bacterium]|nr:acyl-ACP--UDP-N-acetylglucosamine O-acyltransferase [Candidatus Krumholzibacteria bacterium]
MSRDIHPTAVIHKKAELGEGVSVGPYSVIGEEVTIGDGCRIGTSVLIDGHTTLGKNNSVFHGAAIGNVCQDLKYRGERTFVRIGDGNTIREFVTINSATGEDESTIIGNEVLLMAYVHIGHNCEIGNDVIIANAVNIAGHARVHDHASIGGITPIHQYVEIGQYAFIGGGSRIPQDVPPFLKVAGNPARVWGLNAIGLMRHGFTAEQRSLLKKAYVLLFRSGLNVTQALEKICADLPSSKEIAMLVDFIRNSKRGIIK